MMKQYTDRCIVGLSVSGKLYLVTTNNHITQENKNDELWDVISEQWIGSPVIDDCEWTFMHLDKLGLDDEIEKEPTLLLKVDDDQITRYNEYILSIVSDARAQVSDVVKGTVFENNQVVINQLMTTKLKNNITTCENDELSKEDMYKIIKMCDCEKLILSAIDVYNQYDANCCLWFLMFKGEILIKDIMCDILTPEQIQTARSIWMDHIRHHRQSAFAELDSLEEQAKADGCDPEDIEDITTIKQMFRDIPEDCDMSNYNTLVQITDFWPTLLLPKPPELDLEQPNQFESNYKLRKLLDRIDNADDLLTLLSDIELNQDEVRFSDVAIEMVKDRINVLQSK